jgi:hypothetical protein
MRERGYSMALELDTPGPDFVRGLELGRLWEQLKSHGPVEVHVHASNAEMLLRIADSTGRALRTDILDDTWLLAHFDAPV